MKYWSRVSGNRWLVAKMFGVLMVGFHAFQLFIMSEGAKPSGRSSFCFGFLLQGKWNLSSCCCISDGVWACIILWHQMIGSGFYRLLRIRRARLRHFSIEGYKACGLTWYRASFPVFNLTRHEDRYYFPMHCTVVAWCVGAWYIYRYLVRFVTALVQWFSCYGPFLHKLCAEFKSLIDNRM